MNIPILPRVKRIKSGNNNPFCSRKMMWPRKMYLITFHMGNSHLSCAEHLILESPWFWHFGNLRRFNLKLISSDLCKTVAQWIIYANLLHCFNDLKNAFGLQRIVQRILWAFKLTTFKNINSPANPSFGIKNIMTL